VAPDDIAELFGAFGPVSVRRLFGGAGIYADGIMFALVHGGVIYLKTDERTSPAFDREQLPPFSYMRRGERAALQSYRRMPDRLYDDPEELVRWARDAVVAAGRSGVKKRPSLTKRAGKRRKR
jgi:DNA transformation protein